LNQLECIYGLVAYSLFSSLDFIAMRHEY